MSSHRLVLAAALMLAGAVGAAAPKPKAIETDIRAAMQVEAYGASLNLILADRARASGNAADAALFEQAATTDRRQFAEHFDMLDVRDDQAALRETLGAALKQRDHYNSAKMRARAFQDPDMARHFEQLDGVAAQQRDKLGAVLKARYGAGR